MLCVFVCVLCANSSISRFTGVYPADIALWLLEGDKIEKEERASKEEKEKEEKEVEGGKCVCVFCVCVVRVRVLVCLLTCFVLLCACREKGQ